MSTPDDRAAPPARAPRRPLGRGPGAAAVPPDPAGGTQAPSAGGEGAPEGIEPGAATGEPEGLGPAHSAAVPAAVAEPGETSATADRVELPSDAGEKASARTVVDAGETPVTADSVVLPSDVAAEPSASAGRPAGMGDPAQLPPDPGEEASAPTVLDAGETSVTSDPVELPSDAGKTYPASASAPTVVEGEQTPATADQTELPPAEPLATASGDVAEAEGEAGDSRFMVRLDNFEGPFDLLLQLISKHKMDVTEVALSRVTDEFMAHIKAMGPEWDLDQTTEFLVVAATLLDLKAARLLPSAEVEDEADLALLEARDLLFARLLQYRAYKEIAGVFAERLADEARRFPRTVGLEPHHAELLPDVVFSVGPEGFAALAAKAMQPRPKPEVYVDHIHAPLVSVREQAEVVVARLRERGVLTFREIAEDAPDTLTVVARFLALLELYRERAVGLEQEEALGALTVSWSGGEGREPVVTDEFDQEAPAADEQEQA